MFYYFKEVVVLSTQIQKLQITKGVFERNKKLFFLRRENIRTKVNDKSLKKKTNSHLLQGMNPTQ